MSKVYNRLVIWALYFSITLRLDGLGQMGVQSTNTWTGRWLLPLRVLRALLRLKLDNQISWLGSYMRKSAWSTGRFNIGHREVIARIIQIAPEMLHGAMQPIKNVTPVYIHLTKPMPLTYVTCAFLKINRGIWLKRYVTASFIHGIDLFFYPAEHSIEITNQDCSQD